MKKLLITGYMRSGTTFLSNFLNSQKDCLIYRDFLTPIFRASRKLGIRSFLDNLDERQINVLLSELEVEAYNIGLNIFDQLKLNKYSNLRELYYCTLRTMREKYDYKVVGSKVTVVGDWLPQLISETDIHVLYIYRDPRDVLLSAKNRFPGYSLLNLLYDLDNELSIALSIENTRFVRIKFEDLILNKETEIKKISEFLEVEITMNSIIGKDVKTDWTANSSFHDVSMMFDKIACGRWKKQKESIEVAYCEIIFDNLLNKLEYRIGNTYGIPKISRIYYTIFKHKLKKAIKQIIFCALK